MKLNYIFSEMLDVVCRNKLLSIIFFTILTSFFHGLDTWHYTIYNFDSLYVLENNHNYVLSTLEHMFNKGGFILNIFLQSFSSFLQIPILYVISSILIRSINTYLLYKIINELLSNKELSFYISLLFVTSIGYASHGVIANLFWGAPAFYAAPTSGLLILIGFYLILTNRIYWAVIPFALAVNIHLLFGITAFAYLISAFFLYYLKSSPKSLIKILLLILLVGISIFPIVFGLEFSNLGKVNADMEQWYNYVFTTDPDDMSTLYYLGLYGYFFIPFISISLYFCIVNNFKSKVEYLFIGSFLFFIFILIIELLHNNSLFFGKLSEYFIAVQLGRGIWVLMFFSALINFRYLQYILSNGDNKDSFIAIIFCVIYLNHDIISQYLAFAILLIYYKNIKFVCMVAGSLVLIYYGYYTFGLVPALQYKVLFFTIILSGFISLLYYFKLINSNRIFLSIILFFVLLTSIIGLGKGRYVTDLNIISKKSIFAKNDILDLEKDIYKRQGKIINNQIINYIRSNNTEKHYVLIPMLNGCYADSIIYNSPIFISRIILSLPMYSKHYYEHLLSKLQILNIMELKHNISKTEVFKMIDNRIGSSSKDMFVKLNVNHKVKYIVTLSSYEYMRPIITENKYKLYDLSSLL
jgi:hypothetical protein